MSDKDTTIMSWEEIKDIETTLPDDEKAGQHWEEVNDQFFNYVMSLLL